MRKYAIPFAATIPAARKLNESGVKAWGIEVAISEANSKAELTLEKIDERFTQTIDRAANKRLTHKKVLDCQYKTECYD